MKARLPVLVLVLALGQAGAASAHHSFAMYERGRTLTLSGTVKQYIWTSPHVTIELVRDGAEAGPVWSIEGSSPMVLARGGWTSTLLKPGDKIFSACIRARTARPAARWRTNRKCWSTVSR